MVYSSISTIFKYIVDHISNKNEQKDHKVTHFTIKQKPIITMTRYFY